MCALPEGGFHLVDEAMHLEVDVLLQREELDPLEHVKYVPLAHIHGLDVLQTDKDRHRQTDR